MSRSIAILGCGYLGKFLAERSLAKGWTVSALTRNPRTAEALRANGVREVVEDRLEGSGWHARFDPCFDYVVNCVGAASRDLGGYRQSYAEGQESIRKWLTEGKVGTLLFTSSISVYPQTGGQVVDESCSTEGVSERGALLLQAERTCLSPSPAIGRSFVLRLAGLYGPGRHLLVDKVKRGESLTGNSGRNLNLIRIEDAAGAVIACLGADASKAGGIYNVSDGKPASRGVIVSWLAGKLGVKESPFLENDPPGAPDRRVSIDAIRRDLKWEPEYNSFEKGYESILA